VKTTVKVGAAGKQFDGHKLWLALTSAGIVDFGHNCSTTEAVVVCDTADEQAVRNIIEAHLADSDKRQYNAPIDAEIAEIERQNVATARGQRETNIALAMISDKLNTIIGQIDAALNEVTAVLKGQKSAAELGPVTLDRLPDLKANVGMRKLIEADAAIRQRRARRV